MKTRAALDEGERWTIMINAEGKPYDVHDGVHPWVRERDPVAGVRAVEVVRASQVRRAEAVIRLLRQSLERARDRHRDRRVRGFARAVLFELDRVLAARYLIDTEVEAAATSAERQARWRERQRTARNDKGER